MLSIYLLDGMDNYGKTRLKFKRTNNSFYLKVSRLKLYLCLPGNILNYNKTQLKLRRTAIFPSIIRSQCRYLPGNSLNPDKTQLKSRRTAIFLSIIRSHA